MTMHNDHVRTDWLGLALSLLVPGIIVAGCVSAALQPSSWDDTPGWAWGLFLLVPLEGLRGWVMQLTINAYREYRGPWHAVVSFLSAIAIGGCFLFIVMISPGRHGSGMKLHDMAELVANPWFQQVALVPLGIVIAEAMLGLLFFRGDARVQAVRLEAIADIAMYWFMVALIYPALYVMPVCALLLAVGSPKIVEPIFGHLHMIFCLYVAFYFAGKAVLLAYLHTPRFLSTGLLPVPGETLSQIQERRAVLLGESQPD
jgi:hypothetical protein